MEYTDAPALEKSAQTFAAPTAATGLLETAEGQASDMVAVMLSIVPGLGHIYKGYRLIGLLLIFFGTPVAFGLALLIATATAGFGFFLLPIYWIAVMVNVWAIPDRVVTAPEDEGEQVPESSLSLSSCRRLRRYTKQGVLFGQQVDDYVPASRCRGSRFAGRSVYSAW